MQYIQKYATEDQITKNLKYTETVGDAYFDERGILKPAHCNKFEVGHFSLLALMEWGQQNTYVKKKMYNEYRLRFITHNTVFNYEIQTLVSMMHWDEFNKSFKIGCIMGHLKKRGTSFEKLREKAELMLREEERLSAVSFMTGLRSGSKFHAIVRIQQWWLRNHRKYRIYKNIYQLMDEYSVEGGFTGQDSAKYLGVGKGKNLLKIQEDIMKKVEKRRITCRNFSKSLLNATCSAIARNRTKEKRRHDFFAKREAFNITQGLAPTIYGFGPSTRWADHDEPYYCEPCATTDLSYPGGGRSSDSLNNPRWAAQCSRCGKKNPYYQPPPPSCCDEGPSGDEGPPSFLGKWGRRFGLTK